MGDVELTRVTQYRSGTNTLGIVFFCLVFGTFLGTLGEKGQIVIDFFKAVFEVIMRMVSTVMWCVIRTFRRRQDESIESLNENPFDPQDDTGGHHVRDRR